MIFNTFFCSCDNELSTNEKKPLLTKILHSAKSIEKLSIKGSILLHTFVIFFGISSWLGVNATYIQLPLLVTKAPEQWSLPSYIVIVIQLGNIGPLIYTAIQKFTTIRDSTSITVVLVLGLIASLLFTFTYNQTAFILGKNRSVTLLVLIFAFAIVGCVSSVLFLPYIGKFKEVYLVTFFIGEGLSGLIPSIVALGQGIGGDPICMGSNGTIYTPPPIFGVQTYFGFVSSVFLVSLASFLLLDRVPHFRHERGCFTEISNDESFVSNGRKSLSTFNYCYLLVLLGLVCIFANGLSPSIQSYSCLPYGSFAYHLTVTLTSIVNPTAYFAAYFIPHKSIRIITGLALLTVVFTVYVFVTALIAPSPLAGTRTGAFLVVSMLYH